jgi:hypothetical protein
VQRVIAAKENMRQLKRSTTKVKAIAKMREAVELGELDALIEQQA